MNKKILGILVLILVFAFSATALASLTFTTDAITGNTASTIDLGAGNTLFLNSTNNAPITTGTGLFTVSGNLSVLGNATASSFIGALTGNAATATKLAATKTINGIAFDGSANITIPSDIVPGTSGNVLTSNGSVWTSAASAGGGISGLTAGRLILATGATTVGDDAGLTVTGTGATLKLVADSSLAMAPRTATFVVAASDATAAEKRGADYVCDGTADDVEIQAAIDALPTLGGEVYLSSGTFNIITQLQTHYGLWLRGVGSGTILKAITGIPTGGAIIEIKNDGVIRSATAGNYVTISDMTIDANSQSGLEGIYLRGYASSVIGTRIERVNIKGGTGSSSYGILTDIASDAVFSDLNISWSGGDSSIETRRMARLVIDRGTFSGACLQFYSDTVSAGITVSNSHMTDTCIKTTNNSGTLDGLILTGNHWKLTATRADQWIIKYVKHVVITGNVIDASAATSSTVPPVSIETTATDFLFTNNIIKTGYHTANARGYGGLLADGLRGTIVGNRFLVAGAQNYGIATSVATAGPLLISGNVIESDGGASTKGIVLANSDRVTMIGNTIYSVDTGISIASTSANTTIGSGNVYSSVTTAVSDASSTTTRALNMLTGTKPTCNATTQGTQWYVAGGAGVADTMEVCRKDAADAYAWVAVY